MSLSSLAEDEILRTNRRTLDLTPVINSHLDRVVAGFNIAQADVSRLRTALAPLAAESPIQKTPSSNALDSLVKYIPTESVTLYVAATAALPSLTATFPTLTAERLYWGFVALTPILFLLIYIGKRRTQKLSFLPQSPKDWPWWKVVASTVAFMAWALAIPPLISSDAGKVVGAFAALLVSTLLSLVGAVVEPAENDVAP